MIVDELIDLPVHYVQKCSIDIVEMFKDILYRSDRNQALYSWVI